MKVECNLCEKQIFFGNGRYEGKPSQYSNKIFFCHNCREVHHDGVGPFGEEKFIKVLLNAGIVTSEKYENGYYILR